MSDRKSKTKGLKKRSQESSSSDSSSSESTSSMSSDDESNARDLKPIKEYLGNRRELARQLFIAVKGEKLRMMLPQILKKMELKELEEWCANELSGMSKARILSILNGQPMLQSSDSNDTDDSGPSLEIISDTEEWGDISDIDMTVRDDESVAKKNFGSKKDKIRSKQRGEKGTREKDITKSKSMKGKVKSEPDSKFQKSSEVVKVKKEAEASEQSKEKDGESLLDLLELEMRARAIRALIRKEEDIIPTNPGAQSSTSNTGQYPGSISSTSSKTQSRNRQLSLKVVQDKLQEFDSNFNSSVKKNVQEMSEEEDVVLVLQPTTTIELLSSESDDEGGQGKRRNQKLENERVLEKRIAAAAQEPRVDEGKEKRQLEEGKDRVAESDAIANGKDIPSTESIPSTSTKIPTTEGEKAAEKSPKKVTTDLEMFRMLKKKSQLKELEDTVTTVEQKPMDCTEEGTDKALESNKNSSGPVAEGTNIEEPISSSSPKSAGIEEEKKRHEEIVDNVKQTDPTQIKEAKKLERKEQREIEEDKSADLEIIIDLDDYPDDMEDLDTGDKRATDSSSNSNPVEKRVEVRKKDPAKSTEGIGARSAETWATRYYQTEDVQSVIKESKIQSEIRKRLRERQRLARLNNSPGLNAVQTVTPTPFSAEKNAVENEESSTTGSVEEYLALKNVETVSTCADQESSKDPKELKAEKITGPTTLAVETSSEKKESTGNDEETGDRTREVVDKLK